jgi:hypothetical protein
VVASAALAETARAGERQQTSRETVDTTTPVA